MKFGVVMFPTDYSMSPVELAKAAEARGFESIWYPEHSHIPASRKSPWPGGPELPKTYYDVMDPFVAMGAAAAVTSTINLATGICLVVQRDPIQTAKTIATLDQISNGRFLFGIGAGWNAEEMANHGTTDFKRRFSLMRDRVEAMKVIWSESKASYHSEFTNFDEIMAWPKPIQKPHPPVHIGGGFPGAAKRAIEWGDGWMPIFGRDPLVEKINEFRNMAVEFGRDPDSLEITMYGAPTDLGKLTEMRDVGIHRVVLGLPSADAETVLPILDQGAKLQEQVQ